MQQTVFKGSNLSDSALDDNFLEHPHKDFSGVRTGATSAACLLTRDAPQVNLSNCRFHNLQLSSWGMPNRARDFTKACLIGCVFRNSNLEASLCPPPPPHPLLPFTRTLVQGCVFNAADLSSADLSHCDLSRTHFSGAKLTRANLSRAKGFEARHLRTLAPALEGVKFAGLDLSNCLAPTKADMMHADFTDCTMQCAQLAGACASGTCCSVVFGSPAGSFVFCCSRPCAVSARAAMQLHPPHAHTHRLQTPVSAVQISQMQI